MTNIELPHNSKSQHRILAYMVSVTFHTGNIDYRRAPSWAFKIPKLKKVSE